MSHPEFFGLAHVFLKKNLLRNSGVILIRLDSHQTGYALCQLFIATAKWFCNCQLSLRAADCVVKPRRCAASSALYALSATRMKTDHFSKPLCGGYKLILTEVGQYPPGWWSAASYTAVFDEPLMLKP